MPLSLFQWSWGPRVCNFIKKDTLALWNRCFPVNSANFSRTTFLQTSGWLLLVIPFLQQVQKNTLVSGNAGDEENLPPGGRKFFFQRNSLFFFSFFCFLVFLFVFPFFDCLFLKLKIYILIYIWLCRRVSDKIFFTQPISGNKTTFFGNISVKIFY